MLVCFTHCANLIINFQVWHLCVYPKYHRCHLIRSYLLLEMMSLGTKCRGVNLGGSIYNFPSEWQWKVKIIVAKKDVVEMKTIHKKTRRRILSGWNLRVFYRLIFTAWNHPLLFWAWRLFSDYWPLLGRPTTTRSRLGCVRDMLRAFSWLVCMTALIYFV